MLKCSQPACLIAPSGKGVPVAVVQSGEDVVDVAVAGLIGAHRQQQLPHASTLAQPPVHLGNVRSLQGSMEAAVTGVGKGLLSLGEGSAASVSCPCSSHWPAADAGDERWQPFKAPNSKQLSASGACKA